MKVLQDPQNWGGSVTHACSAFRYLSMSWLNIQNVSLGSGPVEGQMWDSVTKGEGGLIIGQTHYIDRHLQKKK